MSSTTRAVSYTHLRAHETVLDLVCRLLLEKKKKKKQKKRSRILYISDRNKEEEQKVGRSMTRTYTISVVKVML
ncbi:hypothetical protein PVA38_11430 [Streptococcus pneumoniae D39]|nr:hypothetical protein PVA38_11430 [Streptococcus pneumoniae D39]